jgi:hypothetical protein
MNIVDISKRMRTHAFNIILLFHASTSKRMRTHAFNIILVHHGAKLKWETRRMEWC